MIFVARIEKKRMGEEKRKFIIDDPGFRIAAGIKVPFVNFCAEQIRGGQENTDALFWHSPFCRPIIELIF